MVDGKLGKNGDILIGHPDYNDGVPIGFLLHKNKEPKDQKLRARETAAFAIQINVNADDDPITMQKSYFLPILLGKKSNPDGSKRNEAQDRTDLYELLGKGEGIFIQTDAGTYSAINADGHVITETQYENYTIASIRITGKNAVFLPVPNDRYLASEWLGPGIDFDVIFGGLDYDLVTIQQTPEVGRPYFTYVKVEDEELASFNYSMGNPDEFEVFAELAKQDLLSLTVDPSSIEIISILARVPVDISPMVLELKYTVANGKEFRLVVGDDSEVSHATAFYPITDDFKINYKKATSNVASDGEAKFYADGVLKETLSNLDIFDINFSTLFFGNGLPQVATTGLSGKLVFKEIKIAKNLIEDWEVEFDYTFEATNKWGASDEETIEQGYWR